MSNKEGLQEQAKGVENKLQEMKELSEKFDNPFILQLIREKAEAQVDTYLKRIAFFGGIAILVLGFFGYNELSNLKTYTEGVKSDAEKTKNEVQTSLGSLNKEVDKLEQQVDEKLTEFNNRINRDLIAFEKSGAKFEVELGNIQSRKSSIDEQARSISTNIEKTKGFLEQAESQNSKSYETLTDTRKAVFQAVSDLNKTLPDTKEIINLKKSLEPLFMQTNALYMEAERLVQDTKELRKELSNVKSLNEEISKAKIVQLIALRSNSKANRKITLPSLTQKGIPPMEIAFLSPGDIDETFNMEIEVGKVGDSNYQKKMHKGLAIDSEGDIGNTGYKFIVEFIYQGSFTKDFALLRVVPK